MRGKSIAAVGLALVALALFVARFLFQFTTGTPAETVFETAAKPVDVLPPCPWRDPAGDLRRFFPGAVSFTNEIRIHSGHRLQLESRLGRPLKPDEYSIVVQRILGPSGQLGEILTRRVRGEHGAIELVAAIDFAGALRGVRLQSQREPAAIAAALEDDAWLGAFRGRKPGSDFRLGRDLPEVPPPAQASAQAIADGVRELLILADRGDAALHATHH